MGTTKWGGVGWGAELGRASRRTPGDAGPGQQRESKGLGATVAGGGGPALGGPDSRRWSRSRCRAESRRGRLATLQGGQEMPGGAGLDLPRRRS